jgi:hypothetical protein
MGLLLALTVKIGAMACTTEPAPTPPLLHALPAPHHAARVGVTGIGSYCAGADWSAQGDRDVTLTATFNTDAPACPGSCSIVVRIDGLEKGAHTITLDGAHVRVKVR